MLKKLLFSFLLIVCGFFSAQLQAQNSDSILLESSRDRLATLESDQSNLASRLTDGEKDLKLEAAQVPSFLQIEDVAAEEFTPYLHKWKTTCNSYHDVLKELETQIDEINQIRVRLESKLRLWKLKEGDLKLVQGKLPKGIEDPDLNFELQQLQQSMRDYEKENERAETLLNQSGKNKTLLTKLTEICEYNHKALEERWQQIRFNRLKYRQQPKIAKETFNLALQEMQYHLRNFEGLKDSLNNYVQSVFEILRQDFLKSIFGFLFFILMEIALILLNRKARLACQAEAKSTMLESFAPHFYVILTQSLFIFSPLLLLQMLFVLFPESREAMGFFIFWSLFSLCLCFLAARSLYVLLLQLHSKNQPSSLTLAERKKIYRRSLLLVLFTYAFTVLNLSAHFLETESEAFRLLKWLLEVFIFGALFSIARPRWFAALNNKSRLLYSLRWSFRVLLFLILFTVIALDAFGYAHLSDYLAESTLQSFGLIFLTIFFLKGLREWIQLRLFRHGLKRFHIDEELLNKWRRTFHQWTVFSLSVLLVVGISAIWDVTPDLFKLLYKIFTTGFSIGATKISLGLAFSVFLALYLSVLLSRLIRAILERNLYPRHNWDPGIRNALSTGVNYIIILIGIMIALRFMGFDIKNITVLAGAIGVGLGFGLQNLANNFASGIVLLIERPVKVGDTIQVNNITGKVKKIGARSTVIETGDQASVLIPNGELLSSHVINWTYTNPVAGFGIPLGVAYDTDLEKAKNLLLQVANAHPDIVKHPETRVEFKKFGDSSIDLDLKIWIKNVDRRSEVQSEILFAIEKIFRENKIEIPYPHRKIFMQSVTEK